MVIFVSPKPLLSFPPSPFLSFLCPSLLLLLFASILPFYSSLFTFEFLLISTVSFSILTFTISSSSHSYLCFSQAFIILSSIPFLYFLYSSLAYISSSLEASILLSIPSIFSFCYLPPNILLPFCPFLPLILPPTLIHTCSSFFLLKHFLALEGWMCERCPLR